MGFGSAWRWRLLTVLAVSLLSSRFSSGEVATVAKSKSVVPAVVAEANVDRGSKEVEGNGPAAAERSAVSSKRDGSAPPPGSGDGGGSSSSAAGNGPPGSARAVSAKQEAAEAAAPFSAGASSRAAGESAKRPASAQSAHSARSGGGGGGAGWGSAPAAGSGRAAASSGSASSKSSVSTRSGGQSGRQPAGRGSFKSGGGAVFDSPQSSRRSAHVSAARSIPRSAPGSLSADAETAYYENLFKKRYRDHQRLNMQCCATPPGAAKPFCLARKCATYGLQRRGFFLECIRNHVSAPCQKVVGAKVPLNMRSRLIDSDRASVETPRLGYSAEGDPGGRRSVVPGGGVVVHEYAGGGGGQGWGTSGGRGGNGATFVQEALREIQILRGREAEIRAAAEVELRQLLEEHQRQAEGAPPAQVQLIQQALAARRADVAARYDPELRVVLSDINYRQQMIQQHQQQYGGALYGSGSQQQQQQQQQYGYGGEGTDQQQWQAIPQLHGEGASNAAPRSSSSQALPRFARATKNAKRDAESDQSKSHAVTDDKVEPMVESLPLGENAWDSAVVAG